MHSSFLYTVTVYSFLYTVKTDHICHAQCSNYIAATPTQLTPHAHWYALHTPTTTHPTAFHTLLCTKLTNTKHICVSGSKMTQDVGMVWESVVVSFPSSLVGILRLPSLVFLKENISVTSNSWRNAVLLRLTQAHSNKTNTQWYAVLQVCPCLITSHCSLRDNTLTATGAAALARALQYNKSLEVLKWVIH